MRIFGAVLVILGTILSLYFAATVRSPDPYTDAGSGGEAAAIAILVVGIA